MGGGAVLRIFPHCVYSGRCKKGHQGRWGERRWAEEPEIDDNRLAQLRGILVEWSAVPEVQDLVRHWLHPQEFLIGPPLVLLGQQGRQEEGEGEGAALAALSPLLLVRGGGNVSALALSGSPWL